MTQIETVFFDYFSASAVCKLCVQICATNTISSQMEDASVINYLLIRAEDEDRGSTTAMTTVTDRLSHPTQRLRVQCIQNLVQASSALLPL